MCISVHPDILFPCTPSVCISVHLIRVCLLHTVPVGVALAVDLGHDVLVVVVAEGAAQLVVVHVGLGLALAPPPGHLVWVHQLRGRQVLINVRTHL